MITDFGLDLPFERYLIDCLKLQSANNLNSLVRVFHSRLRL